MKFAPLAMAVVLVATHVAFFSRPVDALANEPVCFEYLKSVTIESSLRGDVYLVKKSAITFQSVKDTAVFWQDAKLEMRINGCPVFAGYSQREEFNKEMISLLESSIGEINGEYVVVDLKDMRAIAKSDRLVRFVYYSNSRFVSPKHYLATLEQSARKTMALMPRN